MPSASARSKALKAFARATLVLGASLVTPHAHTGTADSQVVALKEIVRAVNAGDAKAYARVYAQDAVITIFGGDELKGRGAIEQYEVDLLRQFPGAVIAFETIWEKSPLAVVHYGVNGRTPAGRAMGHEGLLFYRFDASGLIAEERRYLDSLTPMGQLGVLGKVPARRPPSLQSEMDVHSVKNSPEERRNLKIVTDVYVALDSKREAEFLASFADNAVYDEMLDMEPYRGKQSIRGWFAGWIHATDANTRITSTLAAGDFVLVEAIVRGTLKGALGPLPSPPTAKEFALHCAAIFELENGKILRVSSFMNGKELAESVGQWPLPAMTSH